MNDIDRAVARGAAVLDYFVPDWEFRVAPETVESIHALDTCVLCRVFGTFQKGHEFLFGASSGVWYWTIRCGFDRLIPVGSGIEKSDDRELTAAWQKLIRERRAAVPEPVESR